MSGRVVKLHDRFVPLQQGSAASWLRWGLLPFFTMQISDLEDTREGYAEIGESVMLCVGPKVERRRAAPFGSLNR